MGEQSHLVQTLEQRSREVRRKLGIRATWSAFLPQSLTSNTSLLNSMLVLCSPQSPSCLSCFTDLFPYWLNHAWGFLHPVWRKFMFSSRCYKGELSCDGHGELCLMAPSFSFGKPCLPLWMRGGGGGGGLLTLISCPPLARELYLGSQGRVAPHRSTNKLVPREKSMPVGQTELTGDHCTHHGACEFGEKGGSQRSPCLCLSCCEWESWRSEMVGDQPKTQEMGCAVCHLFLTQLMRFGSHWFVSLLPQLPYQQSSHNGFWLKSSFWEWMRSYL